VRLLDKNAQIAAAAALAERIAPFEPEAVICVCEGGLVFGRALAERLRVQAIELDLRYPLRRRIDRFPRPVRWILGPLKEIVYRATRPVPAPGPPFALPRLRRAVLADDSASSGRTLAAAVALLEARGLPRASLLIAVLRCGARARPLVDLCFTESRVWMSR
jgi:hypoxanthine phosphoribosyltransferase